ncbi:hypothetical protein IWZ03DRAFT_379148 [Phyllosticta citriasiana]|uniref:RING-type domain-containing protein n=1 Tax=Phyllosticta citriasiana TaxID=595635 RepID=A0ABR1KR21_9PEZI
MDIASSLTQEEIPIKLRCAICNKLVINAFGLPCCDQSICENCQSSLPDSCPVCSHSPLSADDCKPKKNLRLTVKAYLKSEEKKRDKERSLSISGKPGTPVTPGGTAPSVVQSIEQLDASNQAIPAPKVDVPQQNGSSADDADQASDGNVHNAPGAAEQTSLQDGEDQGPTEDQNHPTDQEPRAAEEPSAEDAKDQDVQEQGDGVQDSKGDEEDATWSGGANGAQEQGQLFNSNFGFDQNQAAFASVNWGPGGFNPMMMNGMPGMQNGNWNSFGIMGMPGMGVDPMAMSQGMFGGFGGQGMGMNGMNMGMGYGGGYGGGWNGRQMSGNDFGGANAGYYPGGGYNQQSHQQGHFPQMNHRQQQFAKNNFQNQNRFPGSGTFGQQQQPQEATGQGQQGETAGAGPDDGQEISAVEDQPSGQGGQIDNNNDAKQAPEAAEEAFVHQLPLGMQRQSTSEPGPTDSNTPVPPESQQNENKHEDQPHENPLDAQDSGHDDTAGQGASDTNVAETQRENQVDEPVDQPETTPAAEPTATNQEGPQQEQGIQQSQEGFHQPFQPNSMGAFSQAGPMGMNMSMGPMGPMGPMDPSYMAMGSMQGMPHDTSMGWNSPYDFGGRGRGRGFGRGGYNNFRGGLIGRGGPGLSNSGAFSGEVTVLAGGEPKGVGVEGAPTGPRAMREGLPNTGASGRLRSGFGPGGPGRPGWTPSESAPPRSIKSKSPDRERSRSASQSRPKSKSRSPDRSRSRSPRRHRHRHRYRSRSASEETDRERREDKRRHRRRYEDEEDEAAYEESRYGGHSKDRTREPSVEDSSRHRSRRDREKEKDRHRSSRHRDRSHEHRRHRHRSRTPIDGRDDDASVANGDDFSSESGRRSKRDKYRDRDSDYERERERRKEKEREREREREKEKDRKRSRRERERSVSPSRDYDDYEYEDRHHRSSRRRREKEKDKERSERAARKDEKASRTGSVADETEFKIQGRSKDRLNPPSGPSSMMPPPTGPKAMADAPKGPSRHRDRESSSRRNSVSQTSGSATSSSAAAMDPITLEREARNRERMLKEVQRRASLQHKSSGGTGDKRKRGGDEDKEAAPPTGPSADRERERDHRERDRHGSSSSSKRRRGSDAVEAKDSERSNGHSHGHSHSHRKQRRLSYKYEDEENDEARARRVESEREAQRWR